LILIADNIWFTYKARIQAQARLAKNDFHSQTLLIWYALASAVLGVITLRYEHVLGKDTDMLAAIVSIALLVISLLVAGRDFRGRSIEMRRNYLELEELYFQVKLANGYNKQDVERYAKILASAENHSSLDDMYFRVFHNGSLTDRLPTYREIILVYLYVAIRFAMLFICYAFPLLAVVLAVKPAFY
jgi:hypothetical protein